MSASPAKSNRTGCFIAVGAIILLLCCGVLVVGGVGAYVFFGSQPSIVPTPQTVIGQPTRGPIPPAPTSPGARSNTPIPTQPTAPKLGTFTGKGAPFTVQYPSDWTVEDQESDSRVVVMISPDQNASASITYGNAGVSDASKAIDGIVANVLTDPVVIDKTNNTDGSVTVQVEHTNNDLGGRVHGYLRLLIKQGKYYIIQFNALVDNFDDYQKAGLAIINSLTVNP